MSAIKIRTGKQSGSGVKPATIGNYTSKPPREAPKFKQWRDMPRNITK